MSVTIKYKGNTIASANTDTTKTIKTSGKYCEADIEVINTHDGGDTPVLVPASIEENGTYEPPVGVDGFSKIIANVPQGVFPSGSIDITENGTYDVTQFASALVNVSGGGGLPSVISKIDGGSFTVASDTDCRTYDIAHTLGVVPKAFVVWTDDFAAGVAQSVIYLVRIHYFDGGYTATTVATNQTVRISTNGAMVNGAAGIAANAVASWVTASKICANYNTNYKAGITYKWLAWA